MTEEIRIPTFFVQRRPTYGTESITAESWPEFVTVWKAPNGRTACVRQAIDPDAYEDALRCPAVAAELMQMIALSWDAERFETDADRLAASWRVT